MIRYPGKKRKRKKSLNEFESYKRVKVKRIVEFYDGDTILAQLHDGLQIKIRFLLVDTPELYHPSKGKQPYGQAAQSYTKRLLKCSKDIRIARDTEMWDHYGRLLAYVYVDGQLIQEMLVQNGYARVYHTKNKDKEKIQRLYELQEQARKKRRNIWKPYHYTSFDGFHPEVMGRRRATGMLKQLTRMNRLFESING